MKALGERVAGPGSEPSSGRRPGPADDEPQSSLTRSTSSNPSSHPASAPKGRLSSCLRARSFLLTSRRRTFRSGTCVRHVQGRDSELIWDSLQYGVYEGRLAGEIRENSDPKWQIWEDGSWRPLGLERGPDCSLLGCPGGESAAEMTARVDRMIEKVRCWGSGVDADAEHLRTDPRASPVPPAVAPYSSEEPCRDRTTPRRGRAGQRRW